MSVSLVTAVLCFCTLANSVKHSSKEGTNGVVIGSVVLNEEYLRSKDELKKAEHTRAKRQTVSSDALRRNILSILEKTIRDSEIPMTKSNAPEVRSVGMNNVMNMMKGIFKLLKQYGITLTISSDNNQRPAAASTQSNIGTHIDQHRISTSSRQFSAVNIVPVNTNLMMHRPFFPTAARHSFYPPMNTYYHQPLTRPLPFHSPFGRNIGNQGFVMPSGNIGNQGFVMPSGNIGNQGFVLPSGNIGNQGFVLPSAGMPFMIPRHPVQPVIKGPVSFSAMPYMVQGHVHMY